MTQCFGGGPDSAGAFHFFRESSCRISLPPRFSQRSSSPSHLSPRPYAEPPAPAANGAAALSPDEAKRALETLQDDKKRAQMIDTLRAIANASGQQQPAPPAPEQKSPIPLSADGLGAQLLLTVSEEIGEISREIADVARTLTHFPGLLLLDRADRE